jgi:hypothetical protein
MLGVDFEGFSPYSHVYLDLKNSSLSDGIQDAPLLVPGQFNVGSKEPKEKSCYVKTRPGVEVLSTYIEPLMEYEPGNIKARIYGHSHPFRPTEIPAVTLNKYGKGQCIYMGIPLGVSVCWTKSPWLEKLFVNAAKLVHTSVIDAQVPSLVEVNLMEQENRYMLHLIPFPLKSGSKFIEDDITLADIELCLRVPQPASIICENAEFEWDNKETNSVVLKINKLKDHAMFILNK